MTSIALLKRLDTTNQFHIDGTYIITRIKFPLVIYGRTDINRHFHPIIFFLTSHEQECDYEELKNIVTFLKDTFQIEINFTFTCLMQDACQASYNGLKAVYPYVNVLMCWYHLKAE